MNKIKRRPEQQGGMKKAGARSDSRSLFSDLRLPTCDFCVRRAFTIVELLVVIGIIVILIGILLPALNAARVSAKRTEDLSNIRQVGIACVAYANENKGNWPLGSRNGPNLNLTLSGYSDDLVWINTYTFGWFLSFLADDTTSAKWLNPANTTQNLDPSIAKRFCCTSLYDTYVGTPRLANNVGPLANRYLSLQTSPTGLCWTGTAMGYHYFGKRAQALQGSIYDATGTAVSPVQTFTFPLKQGLASTSDVLLSCQNYAGPIYGCVLPHCNASDSLTEPASVSGPGNAQTPPTSAMNGMCFAYTDGSARWVPRSSLWSFCQGGFEWVYFDNTPR